MTSSWLTKRDGALIVAGLRPRSDRAECVGLTILAVMPGEPSSAADAVLEHSDAEDRELVRFENADYYFSKLTEFLQKEAYEEEQAAALLEELEREVGAGLIPDQ